ncbi:hypothetical protein K7X08_028472 [Anisodus acutangulus]|uniref:Nuclear speckle splicing regulatory protein 1 N-terminal domain-containing protein n=1 Tax=Anisodus acutangulus TaxID=402998 RepID=A0A9Q1M7N8_9SOLA|nr:hypothetical protein K7X08_028472 [Anisodus acutangulus]
MKKSGYGLQLRVPPSQQKKQPARPALPTTLGFGDDDDDVEKEISRHASKNKALKEIEEQHKKALEEDPSVFDYDGVYDDMKVKAVQPRAQDREERKPKYIQMLMEKAKQREREHEVIYERKIAKERSKDDHLYADKDKFVTAAYKRKLQEQAKWLEEERLRELREERDDVTKKTDISDFYFSIAKNVAFGGESKSKKAVMNHHEQEAVQTEDKPSSSADAHSQMSREIKRQDHEASVSPPRKEKTDEAADMKPHSDGLPEEGAEKPAFDNGPTAVTEPAASDQPNVDHHKRGLDAVAAAKERFLARKRAKEQGS